jgi:4-hydroxybenzoate polyprenyltransferase
VAYFQLLRLHKPAGIALLLAPCWWGLALAGSRDWVHYALFFLGAVLLRGAGCIINDYWDKDIDALVERTKNRPLANGAVQPWQAGILLISVLLLGLGVLLALPPAVGWWCVAALPLVAVYPLMKRFFVLPQLFLGIVFNWGAVAGWLTMQHISATPLVLWASCIFWTLAYDTLYACQDAVDDARLGVKSSALFFGRHVKLWCGVFYALHWLLLFSLLPSVSFVGGVLISSVLLCYFLKLDIKNQRQLQRFFNFNAVYGLLITLAMIVLV